MSDDAELAEFEGRLLARRKLLAFVGLVAVGGLLAWKFATMASRAYGSGSDSDHESKPTPGLEHVSPTGLVSARGCADPVEACVQRAYRTEYERQTGGRFRAEARDVLLLNDFIPVNVPTER